VVNETPVHESPALPTEPTETHVVATTPEVASERVTATDEGEKTPDATVPAELTIPEAELEVETTTTEPTPTKKPRKLKVKADASPKKLCMVAAALQVLQDRKVAMTCPELIDMMVTEGLWVSPAGKTAPNTLYAAISRDNKEKGKELTFRQVERGRFEAS